MAFALGMVNRQTYGDLNRIRDIRNDFAHHPDELTFDNPSVKQRCGSFYMAAHTLRMAGRDPTLTPRRHFLNAVCFAYVTGLANPSERPKIPDDTELIWHPLGNSTTGDRAWVLLSPGKAREFKYHDVPRVMRDGISKFLDDACASSRVRVTLCTVRVPDRRADKADQRVEIIAEFEDGRVSQPAFALYTDLANGIVSAREFMNDRHRDSR